MGGGGGGQASDHGRSSFRPGVGGGGGGPTNFTFKSPGKSRGGGPVPHPLDPCMDLRP